MNQKDAIFEIFKHFMVISHEPKGRFLIEIETQITQSLLHTAYLQTGAKHYTRTLIVKHYNDLLDRQSSDTSTYVGNVFCIRLANFQEKIFVEISGKKFQTLGIT